MARRRMEVLRSEVIASAASWREACRSYSECYVEPGGTITPTQRLIQAVDALNAFIAPIIDSPGEYVEGSPETSHNAALAATPIAGSVRRRIVDEIWSVEFWVPGLGLTDADLEHRLKAKHQTCSSARNWLVEAGWLRDSGQRKMAPSKRLQVLWVLTPAGIEKMRAAA